MKKTHPERTVPTGKPVSTPAATVLPLDTSLFTPGDRVCVAVSGGADSTALLRVLLHRQSELGIALTVLHVEHGLRGASAFRDAAFVSALAEQFHLHCEIIAVDTPQRVAERKESIEEAARNLRYQAFREALASGRADKIATAHTLDDQAETVLMKLLRGAWTDGLSGIHPVFPLEDAEHEEKPSASVSGGQPVVRVCVRPFLGVTRAEIEAYLKSLDQPWCEDETNRSLVHTRNRIRRQLLPTLREYNPRIDRALAHMAANARMEEQHWQRELARLLPQILLPGKPVRGGGRSVATGVEPTEVALEVAKLQTLDPGLRRRVLRATSEKYGATLDFEMTERLDRMIGEKFSDRRQPRSARRLTLPNAIAVERTARELQFARCSPAERMRARVRNGREVAYILPVPGVVEAPAFRASYTAAFESEEDRDGTNFSVSLPPAQVRAWQPGDRVELAHSSGPKKVQDILDRMKIRGEQRTLWPVIVWQGRIVWMRGVTLETAKNMSGRGSSSEFVLPGNLTVSETRF